MLFRSFAFIIAALVVVANGTSMSGSAQTPTVADIVAKHLAAKGGVDKLRAVKTVKITGKLTGSGGDRLITSWAKRPNMVRREMSSSGQKFILGFDGKTVWVVNPMMSPKPQEVTGPQAEVTRQDADSFDSVLLDYEKNGHKVELVETEAGESGSLHHLKVTKKNGKVQHLYLSAETGLEVKMVMSVEQAGTKGELATELSDYRSIDGIMVPFSIRQMFNGKPGALVTYETFEFNVPIEDSFFQMPGGRPALQRGRNTPGLKPGPTARYSPRPKRSWSFSR
jgi:outer membrane lipoprotein-sorting protein